MDPDSWCSGTENMTGDYDCRCGLVFITWTFHWDHVCINVA